MTTAKKIRKTLARPLVQAGVRREPGEVVALRPDQIERLAPDGYFEDAQDAQDAPQRGSKS
jgi:hypothetical protein